MSESGAFANQSSLINNPEQIEQDSATDEEVREFMKTNKHHLELANEFRLQHEQIKEKQNYQLKLKYDEMQKANQELQVVE